MQCSWCEREVGNIVEADGRKYCGRLCAAQSLLNDECDEFGINNEYGEIGNLFINEMFYEGEKRRYAVKVRECDLSTVFVDNPEQTDFQGNTADPARFEPVYVAIDDECTPDWIVETTESAPAA